jgi:hypothetical protein
MQAHVHTYIHIPRIHTDLLAQVGAAGALGGKDVA